MAKRSIFQKLISRGHWRWIVLDVLMLILLGINLTWFILDTGLMQYASSSVGKYTPAFSRLYIEDIHPWFLFFDGITITIFFWEFVLRWIWAIWHRVYRKWFLYPVMHWYDLLGSIPGSSLRILRVFRAFGLIYRLHHLRVINVNNYYVFRLILQYYQILMEEISNRVAIKLLREVRAEVKRDPPVTEQLMDTVVRPHQDQITEWVSHQVQVALRRQYEHYRPIVRSYVEDTVQKAMYENKEVANLERMPVVGGYIKETLSVATSQIVFGVTDRIMKDLSAPDKEAVIYTITEGIVEALLNPAVDEEESGQPSLSAQLIDEIIEVIITRISGKTDSIIAS